VVVVPAVRVDEAAAWIAYLALFEVALARSAAAPRMPAPVRVALDRMGAAIGRLPEAEVADLELPGDRRLRVALFWLAAAEEFATHRTDLVVDRPPSADRFRQRLLELLAPLAL
jgi:hypothetical protein